MGGKHMVVGERARGASRQDSQRNTGSRELLDETTDDDEDYCLQRSAVPLDPRV